MASRKLKDGVYSVGVLNPSMRVFDVVMKTEYGTSYNAFLVRGEKTALIETCHRAYREALLENISEVCDPGEISYIVLNHTEPDHTGTLAELLKSCPKAQIVCSRAAAGFIKEITNLPELDIRIVKEGDSLDLGGKRLDFYDAPFLHWPDSMFSYLESDGIVFTCDFLGTHYCEPLMLDYRMVKPELYDQTFKEYYDAIFAPFKQHVRHGLKQLERLSFDMVCCSHGPVLTAGGRLEKAVGLYREWSAKEAEEMLIPVFYVSAYGCTKAAAGSFAKGVQKILPKARVMLLDIIEQDISKQAKLLNSSRAFAVGTPTINRFPPPPILNLLAGIDAINCAGKPFAVFGSYGWSGEAIKLVGSFLESLKCKKQGELKFRFVPSEGELDAAQKLGEEFGLALQQSV